jgi:hypothetical protein
VTSQITAATACRRQALVHKERTELCEKTFSIVCRSRDKNYVNVNSGRIVLNKHIEETFLPDNVQIV